MQRTVTNVYMKQQVKIQLSISTGGRADGRNNFWN